MSFRKEPRCPYGCYGDLRNLASIIACNPGTCRLVAFRAGLREDEAHFSYALGVAMADDNRFGFSVRILFLVTTICAIDATCIHFGTWFGLGVCFTLTVAINLSALLGVYYHSGSQRAFWIGFALFGWSYLAMTHLVFLRLASIKLFGVRLAALLKNLDQSNISGTTVEIGGDRIAVFPFAAMIDSVFVLPFAAMGGLIAVWFYSTRANAKTI